MKTRYDDVLSLCAEPAVRAALGAVADIEPLAGLSNRVFRLTAAKGRFILRVERPENAGRIDRQAELHNARIAEACGIGAAVVHADPGRGVMLVRAVEAATPLAERPREARAADAARLGTAIGRLHGATVPFRGRFGPREILRRLASEVGRHAALPAGAGLLIARMEGLARSMECGAGRTVPSHGDLVAGNVLVAAGRIVLIDWEYSAMADPAWDLAYAALECGLDGGAERAMLATYAAAAGWVPAADRLAGFKALCATISALWALDQEAAGNPATDFGAYARLRFESADRFAAGLPEVWPTDAE
ncbi:choline/ethanolamine kinase family protein [Polymorphum gilvum]|uniref:Phosphotransferase enzyme family, putative n=1 Tax=Polymorphum gilvum (strain LMG 25793 / CGMCC 1.9160 / SL003B-26A1) TaxID=991905 RepID=F2J0K3_POLGS|nr:choline/ethanolamine kinase family protein [Polymorphum gilvum]ADZ69671.1 Phosphotransferase enzyme family, putative [Polymorphum gilvum SL003B-26A1]